MLVRSGEEIMTILAALLLAASLHPKELVGLWQMDINPAGSFELRADGTGSFAGQTVRWSAARGVLTFQGAEGSESIAYKLDQGRLLLSMGEATLVWKRAEAAPKKLAAKRADGEGDPRLRQLLLSSAWCSFSYSQAGGTTHKSRVVLRPDGTLTRDSDSEMYSSGSAGTYFGASNNAQGARWRLQGQRLLIDSGEGFQDVGLQVSQNSNGYPILNAAGVEYMMCN
jgi:hypothetical protein